MAVACDLDEDFLRVTLAAQSHSLSAFIESRIPARLRSLIAVDDVLQEVWIAAFRGRRGFCNDRPDALERWLMSITQSRLLNAIKTAMCVKRGGRERFIQFVDRSQSYVDLFARVAAPGRTPSGAFSLAEASVAIRIALASLPEAQRRAVVLRFIEGKSDAEIAAALDRTEEAVHSVLYRGLRRLEALMGPAWRYLSDAPSAEG